MKSDNNIVNRVVAFNLLTDENQFSRSFECGIVFERRISYFTGTKCVQTCPPNKSCVGGITLKTTLQSNVLENWFSSVSRFNATTLMHRVIESAFALTSSTLILSRLSIAAKSAFTNRIRCRFIFSVSSLFSLCAFANC